ncbi:hypothetical protein Q5752_002421 [Cryptotrichosporon argae]
MRLDLLLFVLPLVAAAKSAKCLPSGDEKAINRELLKGGLGKVVNLCPGSVHRLQAPIVFTAPRQTLTTAGNVKGRERAMIIVEGEEQSIAIKADCKECAHATIASLVVDGNRPQMLRIPLGDALVELGNAEGQTIKDCRLYEPRGWSCLHFREGDNRNCRKGHIVDNEIGPAGEEWDDDYDGVVEKTPPYGNPRADGISLACQDSIVERNTVFDTTDGAIVLFGSAGSEVKENEIYSRTRVVLGGINLVDYEPWAGDYTGVRVHHNTLYALSRYLKVGIVIGPSSWSDDTESTVHGASVSDNEFLGDHFGYGIVVSSASGFSVLRNAVDDNARFDGVEGPRCPKAPRNGRPTPFLINRGSARGVFQDDFVNGEVQHIICLNPPDQGGKPYKPWRLRDSPAAIADRAAAEAAEHPEKVKLDSSGYDGALAEALVNYQMTLIGAMNSIQAKLDPHAKAAPAAAAEGEEQDGGEPAALHGVSARLERIEQGERQLRSGLEAIQARLTSLSTNMTHTADTNRPLLERVYAGIKLAKAAAIGQGQHSAHAHTRPDIDLESLVIRAELAAAEQSSGLAWPLLLMVAAGALLALGMSLLRRARARSAKGFKSI